MPIDTKDPLSEGWWMARLLKKLGRGKRRYDRLDEYYTGENGIPLCATRVVRDAYQRLMRVSRTNFAELVVEATRERMAINGFRTGAEGDELGDKEAQRIWQANSLDADSMLVHRAMLSMADSYVIVGSVDDELDAPLITPEDPREVVTEQHAARRRKTIAALKFFHDDVLGADRVYLYLPGVVHQAIRDRRSKTLISYGMTGWDWYDDPQELPAPIVPVVRFGNRMDLAGNSKGEFETHLPILDRINYTILQRLEILTLQAFRQRAVKGIPTHDEKGNEIDYDDIFSADPGALWQLPAAAEMWESGQIDLTPVQSTIKADVQDLAAVTRTPLFYLSPDAANGSAEGASLAREGLIFKTLDRIVQTGESWEQVVAFAFAFLKDTDRASQRDMEVIWASPERYSLTARYSAAQQAIAAGVPWRTVMSEVLQFSPQQIDRMESERTVDAALGAMFAPDTSTSAQSDALTGP